MRFPKPIIIAVLGGTVLLSAMSARAVDLVQISNLSNINLIQNITGEYVGSTDACIYRDSTETYSVTAYGDGDNSAFSLNDGGLNALAHQVDYNDGAGFVPLTSGLALTGRVNADTGSSSCASGNNANIRVQVDTLEVDKVPAGDYSGVLILIISPE